MDQSLSTSPIFLHKLPFRPIKQIIRIISILHIPIRPLIHTEFLPRFLQRLFILYMIKRTIKFCLFFTTSHSLQMRLLIRRLGVHFIHPLHRFRMTPAMCVNRLKIFFPLCTFAQFIGTYIITVKYHIVRRFNITSYSTYFSLLSFYTKECSDQTNIQAPHLYRFRIPQNTYNILSKHALTENNQPTNNNP